MTGTRFCLEISSQCDKRVKNKSQKVLGANFYFCRSYRGKAGRVWGHSGLFLKYFTYFITYSLKVSFGRTALSSCLITLKTIFILILHGRIVFQRALFAGGFLINIWYCISYLLNINSPLTILRGFLHRWLIYWRNTFVNLQFLYHWLFSKWFLHSGISTFSFILSVHLISF